MVTDASHSRSVTFFYAKRYFIYPDYEIASQWAYLKTGHFRPFETRAFSKTKSYCFRRPPDRDRTRTETGAISEKVKNQNRAFSGENQNGAFWGMKKTKTLNYLGLLLFVCLWLVKIILEIEIRHSGMSVYGKNIRLIVPGVVVVEPIRFA